MWRDKDETREDRDKLKRRRGQSEDVDSEDDGEREARSAGGHVNYAARSQHFKELVE